AQSKDVGTQSAVGGAERPPLGHDRLSGTSDRSFYAETAVAGTPAHSRRPDISGRRRGCYLVSGGRLGPDASAALVLGSRVDGRVFRSARAAAGGASLPSEGYLPVCRFCC